MTKLSFLSSKFCSQHQTKSADICESLIPNFVTIVRFFISVECHFVDYKFLGVMKRQFPSVPILGLTATATQDVIDDVLKMLSIPNALIFRAPLNRSNLFYEVFACSEIFQLKFCAEIINTLLTIQLCDCYIQDIEKIFCFFSSQCMETDLV